jgi:hypothetical protein
MLPSSPSNPPNPLLSLITLLPTTSNDDTEAVQNHLQNYLHSLPPQNQSQILHEYITTLNIWDEKVSLLVHEIWTWIMDHQLWKYQTDTLDDYMEVIDFTKFINRHLNNHNDFLRRK